MTRDNKKIVLFDFDGVLANTLQVCFEISKEVNEDFSMQEYKELFEGNALETKLRPDGSIRNRNPKFKEIYQEKTRLVHIPEELKSIVQKLFQNYILGIVSSTGTESLKDYVVREGLTGLFSDILGGDIHTSKAYKIKQLLSQYGVESKDAVYITDTLGDIREASECEVKAVAVLWGWHDYDTLKKGNPAAIIDDPNDLVPEIEKILQ